MARAKKIEFVGTDDLEVMTRAWAIVDKAFMGVKRKTKYTFGYFIKIRRTAKEGLSDIDFMHKHFGGYRTIQEKAGVTYYWLNIQQRRALMIVDLMTFKLVKNKRAAEIMRKLNWHVSRNAGRRLTDESQVIREELLKEMRQILDNFESE